MLKQYQKQPITTRMVIIMLISLNILALGKLLKKLINIIKLQFAIFFIENSIKLRGPNIIVQIDKTKLSYNVNGHRGKYVQAFWYFCIVDNHLSLHWGLLFL